MGIGGKMVRFIKGEPIYRPEDVSSKERQLTALTTPKSDLADAVPVIRIEKPETSVVEGHLDIRAVLRNESAETVRLESFSLFGVTYDLNLRLAEGDARPAVLYAGEKPTEVSDVYAELSYQSKIGEAYEARYKLLAGEADEGVVITGFQLQVPIEEG